MAADLTATEQITEPAITIRVTRPNGPEVVRSLALGDAVVVGASPACGIRIDGDGVAAMHCTISYEDGDIVIEDWDTGSGTYVDSQRIARRAIVSPGKSFTVGQYQFTTNVESSRMANESSVLPDIDDEANRRSEHTPSCGLPGSSEFDDVWDSADELPVDSVLPGSAAYEHSQFTSESPTDLMQVEIEFLRSELMERDARITELERRNDSHEADPDEDLPSRQEVESLVSRLEDLLAELEHSDERLKTMAELLRASEEANQASEEERSQMESWMSEVERRVRQWEEEWHAERETLNRRITELTQQRDEAEASQHGKEPVAILKKLRQEIGRQETLIETLQSERANLQQRIQAVEVETHEQQVQQAVEAALREERLQLSQAKAECARERAKLAQLQEELVSKQGALRSEPDLADVRIRAFREHLKEIRATEPNSRPTPSMSQRLGKLWRKIEGRPLDTD